jgi:predicted nucleotidyltransferase
VQLTHEAAGDSLINTIDITTREKLIEIARSRGITYLALFGSVARDEARPESDVDLAVRFGQPISLLDLVGIRLEMEAILGRPVDLIPIDSAYTFVRESMDKDLLVLYEASDNKIPLGITAHAQFQ